MLTAVCSRVPDSLTSRELLKVVDVPLGVPRRSFPAALSMRMDCTSEEMGLAVPPPPSTETVPVTTRSSAPSRSLKSPSRISSPVPPSLTSCTLPKPPSAKNPVRKSALPAMTRLCPLAPAKVVTEETSVRGVASALLMVRMVIPGSPRLLLKMEFSKTAVPGAPSVTMVLSSSVTSSPPLFELSVCGTPFQVTSAPSMVPASPRAAMEPASTLRCRARSLAVRSRFMVVCAQNQGEKSQVLRGKILRRTLAQLFLRATDFLPD